jgi:hypothetical protein
MEDKEEVVMKDVTAYERYLSATFGRSIEYEGSSSHMEMVAAALAQEATAGVWSFDGDADSDDGDETDVVRGGVSRSRSDTRSIF